jgi:hypothetical protein
VSGNGVAAVPALRRRPLDALFVAFFSVSVVYGLFFSLPEGLGLAPISADSPYAPFRWLYGWAVEVEPAHLDPPTSLLARCLLDGLVHAPFLLVLIYALTVGADWIRVPALLYASSALTNMSLYFYETFFGAHPPLDLAIYVPFNLPWLLMPLLLAWRMRHRAPFS